MKTTAKYKMCRRLGAGVYEKCQTAKFSASESKKARPNKKPKALSTYGQQLIEKQKIRFSYGVSERQLSNYVKEATVSKGTAPSLKTFELLESRLDNVIYRLGLAHTRALARQMASHGHFTVNETKTTIPSYRLRIGDVIAVREGSRSSVLFAELDKKLKNYTVPNWLTFDAAKFEGKVVAKPANPDTFLNFETVLEFYSR